MLRRLAQGWSEVTNAEPGQRALHAVHKSGAFLDQALALPIGSLGVLFGKRRHAHHAAMTPFAPQPTQEPALEQFRVEPIGLGASMFPRHSYTRGMDHVRLDATRRKPARQPEAVAAGLESQHNPRNIAAGFDRLIAPTMQHRKQPFGARLQLLARLTLNAGKHTANQPARLAQLDDGNDRAIVVQGDEGSAQVIRLGHRDTPSVTCSDEVATSLAARPIESSGSARKWAARYHFRSCAASDWAGQTGHFSGQQAAYRSDKRPPMFERGATVDALPEAGAENGSLRRSRSAI